MSVAAIETALKEYHINHFCDVSYVGCPDFKDRYTWDYGQASHFARDAYDGSCVMRAAGVVSSFRRNLSPLGNFDGKFISLQNATQSFCLAPCNNLGDRPFFVSGYENVADLISYLPTPRPLAGFLLKQGGQRYLEFSHQCFQCKANSWHVDPGPWADSPWYEMDNVPSGVPNIAHADWKKLLEHYRPHAIPVQDLGKHWHPVQTSDFLQNVAVEVEFELKVKKEHGVEVLCAEVKDVMILRGTTDSHAIQVVTSLYDTLGDPNLDPSTVQDSWVDGRKGKLVMVKRGTERNSFSAESEEFVLDYEQEGESEIQANSEPVCLSDNEEVEG